MDTFKIDLKTLMTPPAWLREVAAYLKSHATEERITPKQLAQRWEAKLGRSRKLRIFIAGGLIERDIETFKDLSQGEINALAEICRWIENDHTNESLAP